MSEHAYPALFVGADDLSNRRQKAYLFLIRSEYALLFLAAVFSMNLFSAQWYYAAYALIFILSLGVLLHRSLTKPEQDWYKSRALAESVKTLSWRYMMRAAPFADTSTPAGPRVEFHDHLRTLFDANRLIARKITDDWSGGEQITPEMDKLRAGSLAERRDYYVANRIQEQRAWYARKSKFNKDAATKWLVGGVVLYLAAAGLVILRSYYVAWPIWPIEPIIVTASSILGWMQVKKFNELATAYGVTADEIGLMDIKSPAVLTEDQLSDFVNEAELAFSREHTLWIARRVS